MVEGAQQVDPGTGAWLTELEHRLDPSRPHVVPGLSIIGYGEVSAVVQHHDLPGRVLKRMAGFASGPAAASYCALVDEYLQVLRAAGVSVVDTAVALVERDGRAPVVFLLQPQAPTHELGHQLLRTGDDVVHADMLAGVLETVATTRTARPSPRLEVAVDAQLSNWWFPAGDATATPVLLDVSTPFLRLDGRQVLDAELILATAPAPLRPPFRRLGTVHTYFDDYFVARTAAIDLLGNYHKEGRPDRIDAALRVVNGWFDRHAERVGPVEPISRREVDRYYRTDAWLMAFWLQARRAERATLRVLGRDYDFLLPGRVRR